MKVNTSNLFASSLLFVFVLLFANTSEAQSVSVVQGKRTAPQTSPSLIPVRQPKVVGMVYRPMTAADLLALVHQTAIAQGISPKLFESLVRVESRGKICTSSPAGARGIVQLMPSTARRYGLRVDSQVDERCIIGRALTAGAKYLRWQLDTFKDVRLALAGYNAGEGAVMQYGWKIPPYRETVQYVEQICALTYGKVGLAIELAYNRQQAYWLVDALWRGKKFVPTTYAAFAPPTQTVPNQAVLNQSVAANSAESSLPTVEPAAATTDGEEKPVAEAPARKTIRITQLEPRIATRTLSFYKEN